MKKIVGFLLITLTMIITACHSQPSYDSRLLLADSIMQHRPDSALALLRNVNASDLSSEADVALHALLLSQAYDKNYIDLTNDSLISIAVDYFSEGNEPRYAMLAHYYLGRVFENSGKIHKAIIECTKAQQYSGQTNDYLAVGLIYTHLGYNYNNYYDFEKTIEYYLLAAKYYELAQKHYHKLYALSEVASAYINNLEYPKAYDILQQLITEATDSCDYEMIETGNKYMITLYSATKKYAQVYDLYQSLISNNPNTIFASSTYMSIAMACAHIQRENEINTFIDKAWSVSKDKADTILIHFNTANIYQRSKQYERAFKNLRAGINKQDSSIRAMLTQPILTAQRDLYLKELELTQIQKQNIQIKLILTITIAVAIISACIYFIAKYIRRKRLEIYDYMQTIESLNMSIENNSMLNSEMSSLIKDMFNEQFSLIGEIGKSLADLPNDQIGQKLLYLKINAIISKFENQETIMQLEEIINKCNGNLMQILRAEMTDLSKKEYQQMCYHCANFPVILISFLMHEKQSTIYKRRERIRNKIKAVAPIHEMELLQPIS